MYLPPVPSSLAQEFCGAGSVSDLMTICEITLPEDMIAIICQMTLRGLDYLHKSRKIHRDVKSGNILLNAKGEIKLGAHFSSLSPLPYSMLLSE